MLSGIYSITHKESGRKYIGSSVDIARRWNSHRSSLNRGVHENAYLQNAWNKYGSEAFLFEVIEIGVPAELLEENENKQIVIFGIADDIGFYPDKGFNTSWAGRTGCIDKGKYKRGSEHHLYGKMGNNKGKIFSAEARKNMSEAQLGNTGRHTIPHTAESKAKMSAKMKNRPWSQARRDAYNKRKELS
jgi:group I intron endonuclease